MVQSCCPFLVVCIPRHPQKFRLFRGLSHASFTEWGRLLFDCCQCLGFGGVEAEEEGSAVLFDDGFVFSEGFDEGDAGAAGAAGGDAAAAALRTAITGHAMH